MTSNYIKYILIEKIDQPKYYSISIRASFYIRHTLPNGAEKDEKYYDQQLLNWDCVKDADVMYFTTECIKRCNDKLDSILTNKTILIPYATVTYDENKNPIIKQLLSDSEMDEWQKLAVDEVENSLVVPISHIHLFNNETHQWDYIADSNNYNQWWHQANSTATTGTIDLNIMRQTFSNIFSNIVIDPTMRPGQMVFMKTRQMGSITTTSNVYSKQNTQKRKTKTK